MNEYTASNGVTVKSLDDGRRLGISSGWNINGRDVEALREFFRAEEDERLGRWRWPDNPDYVVYPDTGIQGQGITVLRESSAYTEFIYPKDDLDVRRGELTSAARAYFDAHPEPKPWHAAKEGEVWVITVPQGTYPAIYQADAFRDSGGSWNTTDITDARRIWPEEP